MNYGIDGGYYVFGFYGKDKSKHKIRIQNSKNEFLIQKRVKKKLN